MALASNETSAAVHPPRRLFRLVRNQVQIGKPLPFGVRDEHGKLLLARGHVVNGADQFEKLIERGAFVDVEEFRQAMAAQADEPKRKPNLIEVWEQTLRRLERLLRDPAESSFLTAVNELARDFVTLVQRDPDIALCLLRRQDPRRYALYGITHSLFTALTCNLMAQRMGWPEERALTLVKAALTMNLSIVDLQGQLAVQGNPPTQEQQALLSAHPQASHDVLVTAGLTDAMWLAAVLQHHERQGGGGYPSGVVQPCDLAVALRCADVFTAKISPRAQLTPTPIKVALRQLYAETGGSVMAAALIKEFGIYPPGEMVRLNSGELAVVVRRGTTVNSPMAAAVTDRSGMPSIGTQMRDTSRSEFAVVEALPDHKLALRVPPERLYGLPE
jgi:HD-GYP domain-containing protein (c-di-GMP phosphodiesterase class II)